MARGNWEESAPVRNTSATVACATAEELEACDCGSGRRKIVGEILCSSRCTRPDESFGVGRVAKYADKWNDWVEAELAQLVGYIATTFDYCLVFVNCGESWDDRWFRNRC